MITAIEIENFKGIRERVRIELKPITLLFGPNSAGKSSILHALHYAREIFERRNLDADQTAAGGKFVDLGGFRALVHQHDVSRPVILRFELDLAQANFPPDAEVLDQITDRVMYHVDRFYVRLKRARVTLEVAFSEFHQRLFVRRYEIEFDGRAFVEITHDPDRNATTITKLDVLHPVLLRPIHYSTANPSEEELDGLRELYGDLDHSALASCLETVRAFFPYTGDGSLALEGQTDALPRFDRSLPIAKEITAPPERPKASPVSEAAEEELNKLKRWQETHTEWLNREKLWDEFVVGLSQMIVGPCQVLLESLQETRYLGPLREAPPRSFKPMRFEDVSRWANGNAAWDLLHIGPDSLLQGVSDWFSQTDRLNAGYRVERRRYKRLDLADPLILALASGRAFDQTDGAQVKLNSLPTETQIVLVSEDGKLDLLPSDVGIGISQLLPVVVACADDHEGTVVIEQPELHVHPRIQAELGDLFIETSLASSRNYLIETHSEHLILRILRRIRETGEGTPHDGIPVTGNDVAVYYLNVESGCTRARKIDIDETGEFVQKWPDGFFEERAKELF